MSFGEYYNGFSQLGGSLVDAIDQAQAPDILAGLIKAQGGGAVASGGLAPLGVQPMNAKLPSFAGGSTSMTLPSGGNKEIENQFVGALKDGGLTNPFGLAAAAAYANRESRYSPSNITGSWSDPSESGQAGTSGGILSWRAERLDNMRQATAGAKDLVSAQAKFFLTEDPNLTLSLQNAKNAEEANDLMAQAWRFKGYNRPGGGEYAARLGMTRGYLNRVAGMNPGPAVAPQAAQATAPAAASRTAQRPVQVADDENQVQALESRMGMYPSDVYGIVPQAPATAPAAAPPRVASADPQADMPVRSAQDAGFVIPPGPQQSGVGALVGAPSAPVAAQPVPAAPQPSYLQAADAAARNGGATAPMGLPGIGGAQRSLDPALLGRALGNKYTAPIAQAALASQFKTGDDFGIQVVGDSLYRFNKRTGAVELVPGAVKPQTTTVSQGQYLVDQVTGRPLFAAPAKPENVAEGGHLVDPTTGRELYAAPSKPVPVAAGATLFDPASRQGIFTAPEKSGTPSFVQMNGRLVMADPDSGTTRDVTPADMPQGYRAATAEERSAYKVRDDVPLFIGPDGKPQTLAGQTINVNTGEKAQEQAIGGDYGKRFIEYQRAGAASTGQLATINAMERAMNSPGFYSGAGGPANLAFNRALSSLPGGFKDPAKVAPNELFDALSNRVILDGLGGSLGAGISNGDRDFIQRTAPDLAKTPEGNRQLLAYTRALAQRQQDVAKFARDYYANNGKKLDPGFDEALAKWALANPLTPGGRPQQQPRQVPQQAAPARSPAPASQQAAPGVTDLEAEARRRGLIR